MFKHLIRELYASLALLTGDQISTFSRIRYAVTSIASFAPIAFILRGLRIWFNDNSQFATFFFVILIINIGVGAWRHLVKKTFSIRQFLLKNVTMAIILIIVYIILEMLHIVVGKNIAGEAFGTLVQVMTLLYPISKIVKSVFILSVGKYPPEFIMRKLYNFEKNGDLASFFSTSQVKKDEGFEDYRKELGK